jgi:hypothetical protein
VRRIAAFGLGTVWLLLAAALFVATAYVLAWRILYNGLAGSDSLFHLGLVSWVASSFPAIGWWYPWDGNGMPYREGYPLAAHWVTALIAWLSGLGSAQAMQVVQFAINPLGALGIYVFCAGRLRRPLVGVVAGFLYLLSPIAWTFLTDWGFYSNEAATVLFMPALYALDVFAQEWRSGARGPRFRLSALAFLGLASLMGMTGPAVVGAALVAVPAYALFQESWRQAGRWLLLATPALAVGFAVLAAFWAVPLQAWLSVVGGRQPAPTYSPALFHLWTPSQVFELSPLRVTGNTDIYARTSLSPAVSLPALAGLLTAAWDRRVRTLAALVGIGVLAMTAQWMYALLFSLPLVPFLLQLRVGVVLLRFLVPLLAGIGLVALPEAVAGWAFRRRVPGPAAAAAAALLVIAGLAVGATGVAGFANYLGDSRYRLAYGPYQSDQRDLWLRHLDDECVLGSSPLCRSPALTASFNVTELTAACIDRDGQLRSQIPICAALVDPKQPSWSAQNDGLVASTVAWCGGTQDPVCSARYSTFEQQLLEPRQVQVGCILEACTKGKQPAVDAVRTLFSDPPERAALDAHSDTLLKAFHYLTGGGQAYSYNYQLLPSPELNAWAADNLVSRPGAEVKGELAAALGIDAVVLSGDQVSLAADYRKLGWRMNAPVKPAGGAVPLPALVQAPNPTGLAEQRPARVTVLVVGSVGNSSSNPYNAVFEHATQGMIPYADGLLLKGASPYIDDYSDQQLAAQKAVLLLGYRYHDAGTAWNRLDRYVRGGGSLYVETGWQYVDPDWDAGASFAALPVPSLTWGALDAGAPVIVNGVADPHWGSLTYRGGGWGASSAPAVRSGAEPLVTVGGRVVAARWQIGSGHVFWSGMNLLAHQESTGSQDEAGFLNQQWAWLLGGTSAATPRTPIDPVWSTDQAELDLQPSTGPATVLFKESNAPGWSAQLRWPGGSRSVPIEDAESDFMLVRLDSVPIGARLVFTYGPSWAVNTSWVVSGLALVVMLAWLVAPGAFAAGRRRLRDPFAGAAGRMRARWEEE